MIELAFELFVTSDDGQNIKLSSLNKDDMEQWKKYTEARALSEYYKQKIKISDPQN